MSAAHQPGPAVPALADRGAVQGETIDPSRAAAGFARWRRALAEALGEDPGARLDRPDRKLTMLRIFGSTRRLAELCLKHPATAADAMVEGASSVLAQTARDIAALSGGVGGPEAVYAAFAALKARADIAVAVAELSGAWTAAEATAARADFAERLIETVLAWLVRGAINRGELAPSSDDGALKGVFVIAGGDFAHEDLAPTGPLEFVVIFDERLYNGPQARMAERAFMRIGAEIKDAIEGKTGDHALFQLKTPFGAGVGGVGFMESRARALHRLADPQQGALRAWVATSRVVAGDRSAGGAFLEEAEPFVWGATHARPEMSGAEDDPRSAFRAVADVFRFAFGATRPVFRTASARAVFETAAASGNFPRDLAARLAAGEEFAQGLVARMQMMRGTASLSALRADEEEALARLFGFGSGKALSAAVAGFAADAQNTLSLICEGPLAEFERYKPAGNPDDVDKLEDLGFTDGAQLSGLAESWAGLAGAAKGERFAAVAPGLLTAFGETQRPDQAVRLLDDMLRLGDAKALVQSLKSDGKVRSAVVDALGCFGEATAPLTKSTELIGEFLEERGGETPASGEEWLSRYAPPKGTAGVGAVARWREENIARVALCAASGAVGFDAAAEALASIAAASLKATFEAMQSATKTGAGLALYLHQASITGLPGAPTVFGFIAEGGSPEENEQFARDFTTAAESLGGGFFALSPDVSRRPGGPAAPLAPTSGAFKSYVQSEAVAFDQVAIARARVIAGAPEAEESARKALRVNAVARRADIVLRDLDRARAQRLRRDKSGSDWDLMQIEGGLADVDLIIGTLIYKHAAALPALQELAVDDALDALARSGFLASSAAETLKSARAFWRRLATARALARWSDPQREPVRNRFAALLARAAEVDRYALVRPLMRGYADEISRLYAQLVLGRPVLAAAV
jgi:glutamate-ammonia-ligase adenylyltransferase